MSSKRLGVDGRDVDDALVLLGDGSQFVRELLTFLGRLGEDVRERNTSLSDDVSAIGLVPGRPRLDERE